MKRFCLIIIATLLQLQAVATQDSTRGIDTLRAIYLYKLGLYVSSRNENEAIKIGVIGDDSVTQLLTSMKGQRGFQHRYNVVEFESMDDYQPMHVVYLPGRYYQDSIINKLLAKKALIVGNEEFCWIRDYHICLFQKESKLKFKANITQMDKTGTKVSSKLLRLAVESK